MKRKRKTRLGKHRVHQRLPGGAAAVFPQRVLANDPPPRRIRPRPDPAAGGAFSVKDFCAAHSISVAQYYILKQAGLGPREFRAGRILISYEAAKEWRRQREADAAKADSPPSVVAVEPVAVDADNVGSGGARG